MKVINEKGKLFGIINIVDLLALLLVLFVAGVVAWKLFGDSIAETASKNREEAERAEMLANRVKVTYTVRCANQRESAFEELEKFGYPQQLAINEGVIDGAFVTAAYSEPSTGIFGDNEGVSVESTYGSRVDIVVTVEALVPPDAFITVGSQEVRVGKTHTVKTQFWEVVGIVETMDCDSAPFVEAGLEEPVYPGDLDDKK